jgi:hypothetical protein
VQNAPVFSRDTTNQTSSYIFDANNLRTVGLVYSKDDDSYICILGVGDACTDISDR